MTTLNKTRQQFEGDSFLLNAVVDSYREWLKNIFYVILYRFNYNKVDYEYSAFRSAKRGDDLYTDRILAKFYKLQYKEKKQYFSLKNRGKVKSPILHITLEYDSNRFGLRESWNKSSKDFDNFMRHLRNHFGKCSIIRSYESHESGFCHIHLIVRFDDHEFSGRRLYSKPKDKFIFRVLGDDWQTIKDGWTNGFSDIEMVNSIHTAINYVGKYLLKTVNYSEASANDQFYGKGTYTLAMLWFMRKRAYSISGKFFRHNDVINSNNDNSVNIITFIEAQIDLFGSHILLKVTRWKFFGFMTTYGLFWTQIFRHLSKNEFEPIGDSDRYYRYTGEVDREGEGGRGLLDFL